MTETIKLASYFTNDNPRKVWCLTPEHWKAPSWLRDAVMASHHNGEDLPNDWIYSEIRDVCRAIDCGDFDAEYEDGRAEQIHEYADSAVEIYTKELYQWQADMCQTSTYAYAEERLRDLGGSATGEKRVSVLQFYAIEFIAETIVNAWVESLEDAGDE